MLIRTIVCLFLCSSIGYAQDVSTEKDLKAKADLKEDGWKKGGMFTVNFSQVSLSNWAGGGENAIAINTLLNAFANLKQGKSTWENSLTIGYGQTKLGKASFVKSDDRVDITSKYGREAFNKWYYAALLNFRTQMVDGFAKPGDANKISALLAPGYVLTAIGMDYKPNDHFTAFIAPLTVKTTIVMDQNLSDAGAFGVERATIDGNGFIMPGTGQKIRNEMGGYVKIGYVKDEIIKNVNFLTKADFFSNYLHNPKNIDINWETLIGLKVNKYITCTLSTLLIYDDDVKITVGTDSNGSAIMAPRTQFKQVFGAGFSYKF